MTNKETAKKVLSLLDCDAEEIIGEIYKLAEDITNEEDEDEQSQCIVDATDDDFGALVNCAIRYCMGRQTYMPSLVIAFVSPLVPELTDKTLWCIHEDLLRPDIYGGLGDERIDAPSWLKFHELVKFEIRKRKETNKWKLKI